MAAFHTVRFFPLVLSSTHRQSLSLRWWCHFSQSWLRHHQQQPNHIRRDISEVGQKMASVHVTRSKSKSALPQTFRGVLVCVVLIRMGRARTTTGSKFTQTGMHTRTFDSPFHHPRLVKYAISHDLLSYRKRDWLYLLLFWLNKCPNRRYCCRSEWAWSERARQLYNQQKITL